MAVLLAFAFVSGIITILSPCILPVLPIVLSGSVGGGRARPFGVLAGFVLSFTVFTLALTAIVQALGLPPGALRLAAVAVIVLFGLVLIVPRLGEAFERLASRLARFGAARPAEARPVRAGAAGGGGGAGTAPSRPPALAGLWGGLPVGMGLGLVWTPCVGPIMASVISLALTRRVDGGAALITLAYTLGTSIPMLAVMLGGRALLERVPFLTRHTPAIQRVFGVLMVVVGLAVALGWDLRFQQAVLRALPGYGAGLTALEDTAPVREALEGQAASAAAAGGGGAMMSATSPAGGARAGAEGVFRGAAGVRPPQPAEGGPLPDLGLAPPFVTAGSWLNTGGRPLGLEALRGKVVLVDFWTYSCINCVRTIPWLQDWHRTYRDRGLVIIGVHTPEFEFEKSTANVERAMRDLGVEWAVVQDNDYEQWNAYGNRYWPAKYFIDARGRVRWFHFGEGQYAESEKVIQQLLREAGTGMGAEAPVVSRPDPGFAEVTAETYLGWERGERLVSAGEPVPDRAAEYRAARAPGEGEWTLAGRWTVSGQYVVPESSGVLELGFRARDVFLVVEPETDGAGAPSVGRIEVRVDGRPAADTADVKDGVLTAAGSRLYHLVALDREGEHRLRLRVEGRLRLFAFTFG